MKKLVKKMDGMIISSKAKARAFFLDENGDTNFISMLLIIAIVVVLAGLFVTLGKDVLDTVSEKVETFLNDN